MNVFILTAEKQPDTVTTVRKDSRSNIYFLQVDAQQEILQTRIISLVPSMRVFLMVVRSKTEKIHNRIHQWR